MAERLHIIVPCARPQNLPLITKNLLIDQEPHGFEVRLHVMRQGPEADPKGYFKCNEGLGMIKSGLCWVPSDDTLQPSCLFRRLFELSGLNPQAGVFVFSEKRKGVCPWTGGAWDSDLGILMARPENMKRCRVDATQCFFRKEFLGDRTFDFVKYGAEADGALISELYAKHPDRFVFAPDEFVVFGALDP